MIDGYRFRLLVAGAVLAALGGCASGPAHQTISPLPGPRAKGQARVGDLPALPAAGSGRGGYYQDDGPGDNPPEDLWEVPDAVVKAEPLNPRANRPYVVFGQTYTPITDNSPFTQRGVGSWYGKKFHGQRTSSGELYDMYKMTAAHPTLPIPSYARVTSVVTGKSVVVRINDRGPFHSSRIIDLSYTAALKLGLLGAGSHEVEVERLIPGQTDLWAARRDAAPAETSAASPQIAALMLQDQPLDDAGAAAKAPATAQDVSAPKSGFFLQLGAFSSAARANEVQARLARHGGVLAQLEVVQAGAVYRLFCGPFNTRRDADLAGDTLPVALHLKPIIVRR
ncbi:MAG TPA: septal ring lytic transglycosylase RlpA family protein [Telluria sp.]|nr:septal ring lytic transglycosylase RlpA family protein [Telluria sp.]